MKKIERITILDIEKTLPGTICRYNLHIISDGLSNPVYLPVIVARGINPGPTLGLTAAIHGNEINGVPVIQKTFQNLDVSKLSGTIIGVPVLNIPGFLRGERRFTDKVDLNHKMPGKRGGNRSDIYSQRIFERIIKQCDYLVDLHTASFGRINSYYIRADISDTRIKRMAELQNADIVLNNKGALGTLRRAAFDIGIPAITVELRDPNRFQKDVIKESFYGIMNIMYDLKMLPGEILQLDGPRVFCEDSYWIYTEHGGLLTIVVDVCQKVKSGQVIASVQNIFGDLIHTYLAPEDGVVIGKSTNPINQTGSRIIHLGKTTS